MKGSTRQNALAAYGSVVKYYGTDKSVSSHFKELLGQIAPFIGYITVTIFLPLIRDEDLQLAHYALRLAANILEVSPDVVDTAAKTYVW